MHTLWYVVPFAMLTIILAVTGGCNASDVSGPQDPGEVTIDSVDVNGITLVYESYGSTDRETILLIMGLGAQLTAWPDELCEKLIERGYRVVRFDNRDAGLSTHLDSLGSPDWEAIVAAAEAGQPLPLPYSLSDMAEDAVGLLDALNIDQAHIVGASMGGGIAQRMAINAPERLLSLTLIFSETGNPEMPGPTEDVLAIPPPPPPGSAMEDIIDRELLVAQTIGSPAYPTDEQLLRERIQRDMERSYNPTAVERQSAAVIFDGDRREGLHTLDVPTVVLHGDADPLVPVENGYDTAENIPDAELRVIEGMGHDIPLALVDEFADAITTAASRATGATAE